MQTGERHVADGKCRRKLPFGSVPLGVRRNSISVPILIAQPAGVGSITWNVPNAPGLAGIEIYAQALVVAWPFDLRLTNATADIIH